MCEVIPGILEKDWQAIEQKIKLVKSFAKTVHIDIIDSTFVNNKTFLDPRPFQKYSAEIFFELHMMVVDPIQYLDAWASAGFKRFLGHIEYMPDQVAFVAKAQTLGEVGLALDGPTNLAAISVPFEDLDCLLVYTSEQVGFSGPTFLPERLEKVKQVRKNTQIPLEVDGGINATTIVQARKAGATRFVSTSFLFGAGNPHEQFDLLRKACTS